MNPQTTITQPTRLVNIFAVGNVRDPHIRIEGKCQTCLGTGEGQSRYHCRECGKTYLPTDEQTGDITTDELLAAREATPCGHHWSGWHEDITCEACDGTGTASALVRLADVLTTVGPALDYITTIDEPAATKGTDHA